ncbi:N-6 DNA methylase, partial [Thermogladius sp.]|uniref:N-6 DNA methylase n=1 Tax=Thermogladius sp. TaxID=2023064 RepID=UPI003D14CAAC
LSVIRREFDVEEKISEILKKFVNQKFHGVTVTGVKRQYGEGLGGRKADIVVLVDGGAPLVIIETKKKYEKPGYRSERRFHVTSEEVVGQVFAYAAILKRNGIYVPFVATANDRQLALFMVPKEIDKVVNWEAIDDRDYGRVLSTKYIYETLRPKYLLKHERIRFTDDFFAGYLDLMCELYAKPFEVREEEKEKKRQELHWLVIEDLRGFVDVLTPFVMDAIAPGGSFKRELAGEVEKYAKERGYSPTPEQLAREMAYVLMNKIVFYKVLERYYNLDKLKPFYSEGEVRTVSEYLKKLKELFEKAIERTGDFETVFRTGIYDKIEVVESEEVLKLLDWLVRLLGSHEVEKLGDVIGYIYEELIPAEERHQLGQFYTPKPVAELIVKWAVRNPDDKVLDPGCGSGTFLVEAYKRLVELKSRKPYNEIRHVPEDVHRQILDQLYGVDINEFPAHLTAVNLAIKNPRVSSTNINVFVRDYFTIKPNQQLLAPYTAKTPRGEEKKSVVFGNFDAVVGNPPYTRWTEVIDSTKNEILNTYRGTLTNYKKLTPQVQRGVEPGIYVYWIIHSTGFLKEGGRLGMIISDSWLQSDYGVGFGRYLLDNYKVRAVIDISTRVFPVPLVGACILLMEKESKKEERERNNIVFMLLRPRESVNVDYILKLVEEYSSKPGFYKISDEVVINVVPQAEVYKRGEKWINYVFNPQIIQTILEKLRQNDYIVQMDELFEVYRGNTVWSMWAIKNGKRPDVGGEEFFYLTEKRARELGIPEEYLYPLLPSSKYMRFFVFNKDDWEGLKGQGVECYLFLCRKPRRELPESV